MATETNIDIKEIQELTQQNNELVVKYWPQIVSVVLLVVWLVRLENIANTNTDFNYKLYAQFDAFRDTDRSGNNSTAKEIRALTTAITKLQGEVCSFNKGFNEYKKYQSDKIASLDDRYALRKELDARHFKTVFRDDD